MPPFARVANPLNYPSRTQYEEINFGKDGRLNGLLFKEIEISIPETGFSRTLNL